MTLLITVHHFLNNVASPLFGPVSIKYIVIEMIREMYYLRSILIPSSIIYSLEVISPGSTTTNPEFLPETGSVMHGRSTVGVSSFQLEAHAFIHSTSMAILLLEPESSKTTLLPALTVTLYARAFSCLDSNASATRLTHTS